MKKQIFVPFSEWTPDQWDYTDIETKFVSGNFQPLDDGFAEMNSFDGGSTTIIPTFHGGFSCVAQDNEVWNFIGGSATISRLTTAWGATTVGTSFSVGARELWDFAKFGDDVIAVNINNATQKIDLTALGVFATLDGAPPKARHIAVVRDFVVLGNLDESGTQTNYRVRWSAINNAASWTVNAAVQADFQDCPDAGEVMALVGGEYGTILCERGIWRMTYVGGDLIFQFDKISSGIGPIGHGCTGVLGKNIYFISKVGFCRLNPDGTIDRIGQDRVDRYFNNNYSVSSSKEITCAVDPHNMAVWWTHRGATRPYVYYERHNAWSRFFTTATLDGLFNGTIIPGSSQDGANGLWPKRYHQVPSLMLQDGRTVMPETFTAGGGSVLPRMMTKPFDLGDGADATLHAVELVGGGHMPVGLGLLGTSVLYQNNTSNNSFNVVTAYPNVDGREVRVRLKGKRFVIASSVVPDPTTKGVKVTYSSKRR